MIGATLQKKRREKNISLKKAYEDTRIGIKYLIALEEENYDLFSADVYLKGFLRNYANYLGLNGDELVCIYEEQSSHIPVKAEIVLKKIDLRSLRTEKIYKRRLRFVVTYALGGISILAISFMWLMPKDSPTLPKVSGGNLISVTSDGTGKEQGDLSAVPTRQVGMLYLQAAIKEITWIRVIVDGRRVEERNFFPGETKFWNARKRIELRIGNVWGLDLKLNGKLIDVITPSKGAILDLIVDRDMLNDQ